MPSRRFISLRSELFQEDIDLELPGDQPLSSVMPDLLKVLNWPLTSNGQALVYKLFTEDKIIDVNNSLDYAGIENFQTITIIPPENKFPLLEDKTNCTPAPVQEDRHMAAIPLWTQIPIMKPCLVSPKGIVFVLGSSPVRIGRISTNNNPVDIDLSDLESGNYRSSRHHAEIICEGKNFAIHALKTTNGTFLNGVELSPDLTYPLKDQDVIQFGFQGVSLYFRVP